MDLDHVTCPSSAYLPPVSVVRRLVRRQQLGQSKICDLDVRGTFHKHISRRQIPVHQVTSFQVTHPLEAQKKNRTGVMTWAS